MKAAAVRPAPELPFWATIRADMESFAELKGTSIDRFAGAVDVLMFPGVMAVILFRFVSWFHWKGLRPISRLLYILNVILFNVELSPAAVIGPGLALPHPFGVGIIGGARVGRRLRIFQGGNIGAGAAEDPSMDGVPTIGDDCWIFGGGWVVGPIEIGARVRVGVYSVVTRSAPADCVLLGNPARVVRYLNGTEPAQPASPSGAVGTAPH